MSLDDVKCGLQNEVLCLQNFFERAFVGIAITWMLIISINHNTVPPKKPQVYGFLSINLTQSEPPIHFQSQKSLKKFLFYQNLYRTQRTTQEHLKRRWCCPIDPQKCCPTYPNIVSNRSMKVLPKPPMKIHGGTSQQNQAFIWIKASQGAAHISNLEGRMWSTTTKTKRTFKSILESNIACRYELLID